MNDTAKVPGLEGVANMARTRVQEALKSTAEREVLSAEPDIVGHSSRVVMLTNEEERGDDKVLAGSLWGADSEAQILGFAERLASLKAS